MPLGNGSSPVPAEATLSVLEQLNIYIDVTFPSPSAPCHVVVGFVCYAWIHQSDYDSEKKKKKDACILKCL